MLRRGGTGTCRSEPMVDPVFSGRLEWLAFAEICNHQWWTVSDVIASMSSGRQIQDSYGCQEREKKTGMDKNGSDRQGCSPQKIAVYPRANRLPTHQCIWSKPIRLTTITWRLQPTRPSFCRQPQARFETLHHPDPASACCTTRERGKHLQRRGIKV